MEEMDLEEPAFQKIQVRYLNILNILMPNLCFSKRPYLLIIIVRSEYNNLIDREKEQNIKYKD